MSLLNLRKKNSEVKPAPKKETEARKLVSKTAVGGQETMVARPHVLAHPHITEKASASAEKGVYVFNVSMDANKRDIAKSIAALYKVNPVKVTVVTIQRKRITVKGRPGFRRGGKKAYVFLKKGEKIELI